ncbi:MAG TPA: hypothetical protein VLF17_00095 [Candidatus Nitrosotenuis sp.]|nr:hypothetical protein [Candidatus Nitrosotenuis sp.]
MTSQKNRKLAVLIGISIVACLVLVQISGSCQLRQLAIMSEAEEYKKSQDPQKCIVLVDKILNLNAECKTEFDVVDCG